MLSPRLFWLSLVLIAPACSAPLVTGPSLAPRTAEGIDPRVPVASGVEPGPVDAALAGRLAQLVAQARAGSGSFESAIETARRAAVAAGAPQSEGWVVAQQALSVAVAARTPVTRALGDIDELAANALAARGGLAPADLAAIEAAATEVAAIDRRQAAAIDALQARLGS